MREVATHALQQVFQNKIYLFLKTSTSFAPERSETNNGSSS
jgi:hypothetical protein